MQIRIEAVVDVVAAKVLVPFTLCDEVASLIPDLVRWRGVSIKAMGAVCCAIGVLAGAEIESVLGETHSE